MNYDEISINEIIQLEENEYLQENLDPSIIANFAISYTATTLIRHFINKYQVKTILEKGKVKCDLLSGEKKQKCLQDVKKVFLEKNLFALYVAKKECKKSKNPEKCRNQIDEQIKKTKEERKKVLRWLGAFQPNYFLYPRR